MSIYTLSVEPAIVFTECVGGPVILSISNEVAIVFDCFVLLGASIFWCLWAAVLSHYWAMGDSNENYRPNTSGSYHF